MSDTTDQPKTYTATPCRAPLPASSIGSVCGSPRGHDGPHGQPIAATPSYAEEQLAASEYAPVWPPQSSLTPEMAQVAAEPPCCDGRCSPDAQRERAAWTRDVARMLRDKTKVAPELRPGYLAAADWLDPSGSKPVTELHAEPGLPAAKQIRAKALRIAAMLTPDPDQDYVADEEQMRQWLDQQQRMAMHHYRWMLPLIETGEVDDPEDACTERCPGCEHEIKRMRGQLADANRSAARAWGRVAKLEPQRDAVLAYVRDLEQHMSDQGRDALPALKTVLALLASDPGEREGGSGE